MVLATLQVSSPISIWQEKQAVEMACMPEDKGSKQGSTMYIGMYV